MENEELLKMCKLALDKQIPMRPINWNDEDGWLSDSYVICKSCTERLGKQGKHGKPNYCFNCGQKLDWNK